MFDIQNDKAKRTIYVRMSGFMRQDEVKRCTEAFKAATDSYNGAQHLCLADMRGLKALEPESAAVLMEAIGYQRRNGVVLCAHVSDSTIARLQMQKVARSASLDDKQTIDCVSPEEAEQVLLDARTRGAASLLAG